MLMKEMKDLNKWRDITFMEWKTQQKDVNSLKTDTQV